jgi:hypothetical protein
MRRLLVLVLGTLILSGCVVTNSNTNYAAKAEAEATIRKPDEWPSSVVEASNILRSDARAGLIAIGEIAAAEEIEPWIADREYPAKALCYNESSVYEDDAERFVYDSKQVWFEADRRDLDVLVARWSDLGYVVRGDLDSIPGSGVFIIASTSMGELKVGVVPGRVGEFTVWLLTPCFTLGGKVTYSRP